MERYLSWNLALLLVASFSAAAGQPVGCTEDYQCVSVDRKSYCDNQTHICRACLNCEDFKRRPPRSPMKCITSVVDCGSCFDGLVEDVQDLHAQCAPLGDVSPAHVWVAIALGGLLLFAAAVAIVVYVLRNTDTFRILASTRTSVQSGCPNGPAATAPELPPSYNTLYSPVRPESPVSAPPPPRVTEEEAASPLFKRPPPSEPARESAGSQEANFYYNPNYVRGPHLPSSQPSADSESELEYLHDDNTAESPWTPDTTNNNASGENSNAASGSATSSDGAASTLSAQLATARVTSLVRPPAPEAPTPSKQPRLRQDTNNNRNNRERAEETLPRGPIAGPILNILVNVQQHNDLKL